jgi:CYTH domain-containing protein
MYEITQHYGEDFYGPFRVRKQFQSGFPPLYFLTRKTHISSGIAHEIESNITLDTFTEMKDTCTDKLSKNRFIFEGNSFNFEVDLFTNNMRIIIMEVELPSLDVDVKMPYYLEKCILTEITGSREFSNHALAKKISNYSI